MTREQIIEWARKAEMAGPFISITAIERFAELVAAHEREQCALVCDVLEVVELSPGLMLPSSNRHCAQAIRAREEA